MPKRRKVRSDISRVGSDCNGGAEVHLLPSRSRLVRKSGGSEQRAGAGPEIPDVRASAVAGLVETNARDVPVVVRPELYAHFNRAYVSAIILNRSSIGTPCIARAIVCGYRDGAACGGSFNVSAVVDRSRLDRSGA